MADACCCDTFNENLECGYCEAKRTKRSDRECEKYWEKVNNACSVMDAYHIPVEQLRLRSSSEPAKKHNVDTISDAYVHVLDVLELLKALA